MEHRNRNTVNALCKDIEAKLSLCLQEAMAYTQPPGFGDNNTADVRLHLIDSAGVEYPGNPLLLHSQVLKKAEFFKTKIFQSGSSAKRPFEIKVTCSSQPESYIKCIQLMYSCDTDECFNFTDVDEALAILPVASEVMLRDCMKSSMEYLAAVRWSHEQEAKLRVLLSSLNIIVLPDLAARLGILSQSKSDSERIKMVKESVQDWWKMTYRSQNRSKERIFSYFKLNTSPAVKDACRDAMLNQFKEDVEAIKSNKSDVKTACSDLSWLLDVISNCDAKLFATVVKEFCEDADLRKAVAGGALQDYYAAGAMLSILILQILKAMGNGDIITPISFRVDFLTNWTDPMLKLVNVYSNDKRTLELLEEGIIGVGETLPLVEQKRIYSVCQGIFTKYSKSMSGLFDWWAEKLHEAIILDQL